MGSLDMNLSFTSDGMKRDAAGQYQADLKHSIRNEIGDISHLNKSVNGHSTKVYRSSQTTDPQAARSRLTGPAKMLIGLKTLARKIFPLRRRHASPIHPLVPVTSAIYFLVFMQAESIASRIERILTTMESVTVLNGEHYTSSGKVRFMLYIRELNIHVRISIANMVPGDIVREIGREGEPACTVKIELFKRVTGLGRRHFLLRKRAGTARELEGLHLISGEIIVGLQLWVGLENVLVLDEKPLV